MNGKSKNQGGKRVPSRRLSRLAGLGGMAINIAGNAALNGAQQLAAGKRPKVTDLIMTPSNARKVTQQLSHMRGAAMKIGQMISMDSGDFLPKELADILARLRADAKHMPRAQLNRVLKVEWGEDWQSQFAIFDYLPIAAASIGQVQHAELPNGDTLAIKVQYPGVRDSIDSDVNNVAALLRMTGLIPASLELSPIIEEGRRQLHQEADYVREADYLSRFGVLLSDDTDFEVPKYYPELSTDKILAMSYIESVPIEAMIDASQDTRDRIIHLLIELTLRELFVFKIMQTDPNFANYRYNTVTHQLVLLDFGASRDIDKALETSYRKIMQTTLSGTTDDSFEAATQMGLISEDLPCKYEKVILQILDLAIEPFRRDETFDFGNNQIAPQIRSIAMDLAGKRDLWHVPPAEMLFIQRKFGGIYMLATRLRAKVNLHALVQKYAGG